MGVLSLADEEVGEEGRCQWGFHFQPQFMSVRSRNFPAVLARPLGRPILEKEGEEGYLLPLNLGSLCWEARHGLEWVHVASRVSAQCNGQQYNEATMRVGFRGMLHGSEFQLLYPMSRVTSGKPLNFSGSQFPHL